MPFELQIIEEKWKCDGTRSQKGFFLIVNFLTFHSSSDVCVVYNLHNQFESNYYCFGLLCLHRAFIIRILVAIANSSDAYNICVEAKWAGINANVFPNREHCYYHVSLVFYCVPFFTPFVNFQLKQTKKIVGHCSLPHEQRNKKLWIKHWFIANCRINYVFYEFPS